MKLSASLLLFFLLALASVNAIAYDEDLSEDLMEDFKGGEEEEHEWEGMSNRNLRELERQDTDGDGSVERDGLFEIRPCIDFSRISQATRTNPNSDETCRTNTCPGGCCRAYEFLFCDTTNGGRYVECICNQNTATARVPTRAPTIVLVPGGTRPPTRAPSVASAAAPSGTRPPTRPPTVVMPTGTRPPTRPPTVANAAAVPTGTRPPTRPPSVANAAVPTGTRPPTRPPSVGNNGATATVTVIRAPTNGGPGAVPGARAPTRPPTMAAVAPAASDSKSDKKGGMR